MLDAWRDPNFMINPRDPAVPGARRVRFRFSNCRRAMIRSPSAVSGRRPAHGSAMSARMPAADISTRGSVGSPWATPSPATPPVTVVQGDSHLRLATVAQLVAHEPAGCPATPIGVRTETDAWLCPVILGSCSASVTQETWVWRLRMATVRRRARLTALGCLSAGCRVLHRFSRVRRRCPGCGAEKAGAGVPTGARRSRRRAARGCRCARRPRARSGMGRPSIGSGRSSCATCCPARRGTASCPSSGPPRPG